MALLEESYSLLNTPTDEPENDDASASYPFVDKSTLRTKQSDEPDEKVEAVEDSTDSDEAANGEETAGRNVDEETPVEPAAPAEPAVGPAAPQTSIESGTPVYLRLAKITLGVIVLLAFAYVVHWIGLNVFSYDISAGLWQRFVALLNGCLDRVKSLFSGAGSASSSVSPVPTAAAVAAAAAASTLAEASKSEITVPVAKSEGPAVKPEPTEPTVQNEPSEPDTAASQRQNVALTIKPNEAVDQEKSAVSETVVASVEHLLDDIATAH